MVGELFVNFKDIKSLGFGFIEVDHANAEENNGREESKAARERGSGGTREKGTNHGSEKPMSHGSGAIGLATSMEREHFRANDPGDGSPAVGESNYVESTEEDDQGANSVAAFHRRENGIGDQRESHDKSSADKKLDTANLVNREDRNKGSQTVDNVETES